MSYDGVSSVPCRSSYNRLNSCDYNDCSSSNQLDIQVR